MTDDRWLGAVGRGDAQIAPCQFRLNGEDSMIARDDNYGQWSAAAGVAVDTEYRLAIVVAKDSLNGSIRQSFYRDGVLIGSVNDRNPRDQAWTNLMSDLWIGSWNQKQGSANFRTGDAATPSVIKVNQVRLFHFAPDMFGPSLLLAAATPVPDQAPTVALDTPTDNQLFLTLDPVSVSSTVTHGTAPFSVQYAMRPLGGSFATVGTSNIPPYSLTLGTLAAGSYELKATVTDSAGTPRTGASAVRSITVAAPAITVDKDYTFNAGPEADLLAYGSDAPVYTGDGQVILPPNAYLKGTGLYSLPYTNFGMEVIMTQTSNTDQWRAIMHVGSEAWNAGFHLLVRKGDPRFMYRDDQVGEFVDSWAPIAVDTEYRLAIVVTPKPDGNVLKSCYLNGVLVGTRTDGPWNGWTMDDLWLGNCTQGPGWDGPYTTIKINEARVFHFAQGMFHPSLLLTAPTGGVTPPASSYASWASNMGIAGQPANGDADHDGVPNAVEMVLGGDPKNAMDAGLMPTLAAVTNPAGVPAGDYLEFTYRRTDLSVGAGVTAECQFNSDLGAAWTTAQDGVGGVKVLVTNNYAPYGAATARVQVYVPRAGHATLFARLHVAVP